MKVLCCGDRHWGDKGQRAWDAIWTALKGLGPLTVIIEGDAPGADRMCGNVAHRLDYDVKKYPADWERYGRAAGPIRNQQMLDANPDIGLVLAFHDNLDESKGTKDMVKRARAKGIPVNVISTEHADRSDD